MRKIGYARVSTKEQDLQLQLDALNGYGCDIIFADKGQRGKWKHRPELDKCMKALEPGDTLVVWKLDRLYRSVVHFAAAYQELVRGEVSLVSITQAFDTRTSSGRLMMNILSGFAEFESDMISERTAAGMQAAIAQGKKMGPKFRYADENIVKGKVPKSTYYRRRKNGQ